MLPALISGCAASPSLSLMQSSPGSHPLAFLATPCSRRTRNSNSNVCSKLLLPSCASTINCRRKSLSASSFHSSEGTYYRRSLLPALCAKNQDNDGSDEISEENNNNDPVKEASREQLAKEDAATIIPKPPQFLSTGYSVASFLNIMAGLVLIWNVGIISKVAISSNVVNVLQSTRYQRNILATYTAGSLGHLFLAAGSCNILSGAVKTKNRLYTSDTYKRMTMGTLIFSFLGLFSLPGEAGCITSSTSMCGAAFVITQLAKFVTAFVSFVGWEYSAGGFGSSGGQRIKNILKEIGRGFKGVYKNFPVSEERPPTFYRTFFILVSLGNLLFNLPELVFNLQQGGFIPGLFSLPISLSISSMARLGLLSVLIYILKDAAERRRLEGSTFVKLNMMIGLWAFGVGIAQGLIDSPTVPFNMRRAGDKILFGLLFLNNGILCNLSKMGLIKKRDVDEDPDADPPLRIVF